MDTFYVNANNNGEYSGLVDIGGESYTHGHQECIGKRISRYQLWKCKPIVTLLTTLMLQIREGEKSYVNYVVGTWIMRCFSCFRWDEVSGAGRGGFIAAPPHPRAGHVPRLHSPQEVRFTARHATRPPWSVTQACMECRRSLTKYICQGMYSIIVKLLDNRGCSEV